MFKQNLIKLVDPMVYNASNDIDIPNDFQIKCIMYDYCY